MSAYELAQLNIAVMREPLESPAMADFVANLDRINALAETSAGFIWRLQTGDGNATAMRPMGENTLVNVSSWRDVESLNRYVYESAHVEIMRRRKEWFERLREAHVVLWWVRQGHRPTVAEAIAKLELLRSKGPTAEAFTFGKVFPPPDASRAGAPAGRGGAVRPVEGARMTSKEHWERVYSTRRAEEVSWYQPLASRSLALIRGTGAPHSAAIIDVGGGASTLVDDLVADGCTDVTVLDLSRAALETARRRLAGRAGLVTWLEGDVTAVELPAGRYDVWHDRAAFHFLTAPEERQAYIANLLRSVKPLGHVIIATFADDGPTQCSGLPVMRYTPEQLHAEFGGSLALVKHEREEHHTPSGKEQKFIYCHFRVAPA